MMYADSAYYADIYGGTTIPEESRNKYLGFASRHVDSLTYNRIVGRGFSELTPFQQSIIREVVCLQADFEYENDDEIGSILSGYSINGVSDKGVAIRSDVYALLSQTGLCCRLMR